MASTFAVKVKQTGRVKPANLDNGALTRIGREMVKAQKARWAQGINASGNAAKPLTARYAKFKAKVRGGVSRRDMNLHGTVVANFDLRKANQGVIRAENTTREARQHARQAQLAEEMIGLAGTDQVAVFQASQGEYGAYLQKAWVPIG